MEINTAKGTKKLKEATMNDIVYVSHQELKALAKEDGVMFDFPHICTENIASAMCVVSNVEGMRCYGIGQAQSLTHAANLAFDNAMIDLYEINARSCVEFEIMKTCKKAAKETVSQEMVVKEAEEEAVEKKISGEAAKEKSEEEAAKKTTKKVIKKKAEEESTAKKAAENTSPAAHNTSYENDSDWIGCHSLTPEDPDDTVINYGPFKQTEEPSLLKPGPKYLSQVLKYRSDFVEKLVGLQPPTFMPRIPGILRYCNRHGIGLHATSSQAHDILAQYGVKEL